MSSFILLLGGVYERVHQPEAVHLRLEVVVEHCLERRHLRVHYHYARGYPVLAQGHALVGHGHGQIVYAVVLQRLGHLHGPCAVCVGLDHAHDFRLRLEERAVRVEVCHERVEVHFEYRLVHLLLQKLRQAVEAERSRAFYEYNLVAQRAECGAANEAVHTCKEVLFRQVYCARLSRDVGAYAYELVHTALCGQLAHFGIEPLRTLAALVDVAQYERAAAPVVVGAAVHEVEGDVERVDVGVVGVVYERAAALPLLHLKAHGHRLQGLHACCEGFGLHPEAECHTGAGKRAAERGVVDERQAVAAFAASIYIMYGRGCSFGLNRRNVERRAPALAAPPNLLSGEARLAQAAAHGLVVGVVHHHAGVVEQRELLPAFLLHGAEVLLVCRAERGEHAYRWLYDVAQGLHFPGAAYACLEESHVGMLVQQPHRQWHAYLRIVALRRACDHHLRREQLVKPLLDHRLAVRPGDAHDGDGELVAVAFGQALERFERVHHLQEVCPGIFRNVFRHAAHHKVAHAAAVKLRYVAVAVVALGAQGEEKGLLRETERAAVGKQPPYAGIGLADAPRPNERGDFFD